MKTPPGPHAMTAQAGAVAAWQIRFSYPDGMIAPWETVQDKGLADVRFDTLSRHDYRPEIRPLYTTPPAAVPVEALEGLMAEWEARSRAAHPTDAMLINKHARELQELIKERSNG